MEARVRAVETDLAAFAAEGGPREADAQANMLAQLSGLDVTTVQTALSLLFALLVEFGAAFGLFVAALAGQRELAPVRQSRKPQPEIARLARSRRQLRSADGRLMIT